MSAPRYAVYYAPAAEQPLWRAGCVWLGRDAADALDLRDPPARRREPWRYGFHATLKAPFRLCPSLRESQLDAALQALAARTPAFEMPALAVDTLADFVALRPAEALPRGHALWRLADDCVRELDAFRAPPTPAELARRLARPLEAGARLLLAQWGYPHVLDGWRFHITLSDSLPPTEREAMVREAQTHFAAALAQQPLRCSELCLFVQAAPGLPFVLQRRYALAAASAAVVSGSASDTTS
jgi:putative phosphonate metabolism protein